jgi:hypothetical protein
VGSLASASLSQLRLEANTVAAWVIGLASSLVSVCWGRDVAGQVLAAAYASGQDKGPQMRAEMQQAKAATEAEALRDRADPDQAPGRTTSCRHAQPLGQINGRSTDGVD